MIRSLSPERLDTYSLKISGDTVYWLKLVRADSGSGSVERWGPDGHLVGFRGQTDPQGIKTLIERWRQDISARAADSASVFADTMADASRSAIDKPAAPRPGVRRVTHPGTGLTIDVLQDWKVTVKKRTDGPLLIFGVQILPRIIRDGPERPYAEGSDWNYLSVSGAPEAGLEMTIHDRPLDTTLDAILDDPFTKMTGAEILNTEPDLQVGKFRGFAVIRRMPTGAQVRNGPKLTGPVMLRQIWLSHGSTSVEIQGQALENQPDIQRAIDAMVSSLSFGG